MSEDTRTLAERSAAMRAEEAEHDAPYLETLTGIATELVRILRSPEAAALKAQVDALASAAASPAEAVVGDKGKARATVVVGALTRVSLALKAPASAGPTGA